MHLTSSLTFRLPQSCLAYSWSTLSECGTSGRRWKPSFTQRVAQGDLSTYQTNNAQGSGTKVALRIMPLGGSITYGVGSPDGNGYRKALCDMLTVHGYTIKMVGSRNSGNMVNNENEGWRGRRIDQIHEKAKKSTAKFLPNLFTINAGSNDCLQDFQISSAGARLDGLVEDLWMLAPDATVILSTLIVTSDEQVNTRVLRVNEQICDLVQRKSAADKKICLADMCDFLGGPLVTDLVDDGIHPNTAGYVKMAKIWADSIDQAAKAGILHASENLA